MLGFAMFIRVLVFLNLALLFMSRMSFITLCILSCKIRIRDTCNISFFLFCMRLFLFPLPLVSFLGFHLIYMSVLASLQIVGKFFVF